MARRLIDAAHDSGDRSMPDAGNLCHNIYRWERGMVCPGERYKIYYCQAFGIPVSQFGAGKAETAVQADDLAMTVLGLLAAVLGLQREFSGEALIIRREKARPD